MGCHLTKTKNVEIENHHDSVTKSQINQTKYGQESLNIDNYNPKNSQQIKLLLKNKTIMIDQGLVNLEGFSQKSKQSGFQRKQMLFAPIENIF